MYLCHFQSQDAKSNSTWDLINILKFCYWIYIRASMSMTDSHMPCHRAFHWEEFYSLFTDYCSLSLSRYLFSKTVSSICKQNWKKNIQREKEREYIDAKEEYIVGTNLNFCQTVLWDQVEPFLTRWLVTVELEVYTFLLYRTYPLRRAIKIRLNELSMSPFKEEILHNKIM